ncbi:helix-turn-helix transcriptional regulator [Candidatus Dojkabacteria bacterium]|jgi:hypothetical protein|uniref:Helix-turn-helix transcriptional regulator n=1 Tax=Candidatus Dojkabacteria bacterium TaxID=2099670 RepID=A0A955HYD1_9BACT|nr:helix-turn-helix transcriptional regulator [Candidatus Dojkabacteria bacterium]
MEKKLEFDWDNFFEQRQESSLNKSYSLPVGRTSVSDTSENIIPFPIKNYEQKENLMSERKPPNDGNDLADIEEMKKKKEIILNKMLPMLLDDRGMSWKQLSELSGISLSTLYEWKNGRLPSDFSKIKIVSQVLCCSVHKLLWGTPDELEQLPQTEATIEGTYEIVVKKKGGLE